MNVATVQNETLDALLYRVHGTTNGLEAVCLANPHALHPPLLPAGVVVTLPERPLPPTPPPRLNLWS